MLKFILTIALILLSTIAYAADTIPMSDFAKLPILHEGRIKPLDSFARIELSKFSKKDTFENQPAINWLASTLFDPSTAVGQKIFLVENADTRHALGLEERKKPLYSFAELSSGLEKTTSMIGTIMDTPPKQQSKDQKYLLTIHENALEYTLILRSFSSVLPLNINPPASWLKKAGIVKDAPPTYSALKKIEPELQSAIRALIKRKGDDPAHYTADEQATAMLGWQLQTLGKAGENNALFRVIPFSALNFASPWELINDGKATPATTTIINDWEHLSSAWQSDNITAWDSALKNLQKINGTYNPIRLTIETAYNRIAPFTTSLLIFAAAMILALLNLAGHNKILYRLGYTLFCLGIATQGLGLTTRIYLMERPPVGTLYESLLFVGFIAPLVALVMEYRAKNGLGLVAGSVAATMIGLLAQSMMGEGDNMKMLGAVLNTRFWLTTHVLCITIGYGWCLVTSVLAHLLLIGRVTKKISAPTQTQLLKTITTLSLFSLLFTTVGTILGGIWADQSWGRFWGWDPKENGALLIVLWLIWLIHGKIAAQISETLWLGGMAFLSVIVSIAWIGVNLLGVGLHSYGFIEGVFWGLGLFTLFETITIGGFILRSKEKEKKFHAA
jgi:ABC-type transport system involved in cytochrome c biogenesis permease subunit